MRRLTAPARIGYALERCSTGGVAAKVSLGVRSGEGRGCRWGPRPREQTGITRRLIV